MPDSPQSINLLEEGNISSLNKFVNSILTIGKLLVIVVELVAIICFVYRFSLDQKLSALNLTIESRQDEIASLKKDEDKYRNLQDRIALAATFLKKGANTTNTLTEITALIPEDVELNNFFMNDKQVNLDIQLSSISSLSELINSLQNYNRTEAISINDIENVPSIGLFLSVVTVLSN